MPSNLAGSNLALDLPLVTWPSSAHPPSLVSSCDRTAELLSDAITCDLLIVKKPEELDQHLYRLPDTVQPTVILWGVEMLCHIN